jgi:hypothetical protein
VVVQAEINPGFQVIVAELFTKVTFLMFPLSKVTCIVDFPCPVQAEVRVADVAFIDGIPVKV